MNFSVEVEIVKNFMWKKSIVKKLIKNSEHFFTHFAKEVQNHLSSQLNQSNDSIDDDDENLDDNEGDQFSDDENDENNENKENNIENDQQTSNQNEQNPSNNLLNQREISNDFSENFLRFFDKIFSQFFENKKIIYFSILLIILLFVIIFLQTLEIHWAEDELKLWQKEYALMENRLSFLQTCTSRLAGNLTNNDFNYLENHWRNWRKSKGSFWRFVEWYSQLEKMKFQMEKSLNEINQLLTVSGNHFPIKDPSHSTPSISSYSSSSIKTRLSLFDTEKVRFNFSFFAISGKINN